MRDPKSGLLMGEFKTLVGFLELIGLSGASDSRKNGVAAGY